MPTGLKTSSSMLMTHFWALVAVLFWGLSFVSTKVLLTDGGLSPVEAYVYRFALAYLIILAVCHKRLWADNLRDELLLILVGMTGGSIYFITENTALTMTSTSNVSLLSSTSPLVTILIVGLIYRSERPGRGIITGSLVAFAGVCCVVLNSVVLGQDSLEINPMGDLIALASSFSWAFYSLILKRLNVTYDAMFITRKTFFYGVLTALPFMLLEPEVNSPLELFTNLPVLGNLLFLVLCPSIAGYYLWAMTIKDVGAVKANNYMYLQPVITLIASVILLGERISVLGYLGFALILFGLWLGEYLQRRMIKHS